MDSVKVVGGRGQHKLAHQLWVPNSDLQRDTGSHAMAEEVVIFDAELPECGSGIVGHLLEAQRSASAVRGAKRSAPAGCGTLGGICSVVSLFGYTCLKWFLGDRTIGSRHFNRAGFETPCATVDTNYHA